MYTKIPKEWRDFEGNATLNELNDLLVELHILTIVFISILMVIGVFGNSLVVYVYTQKYHPSTHRCFILWLAWIDLIACSVGNPLLIVSMLYPYMFPSEAACKTLRFLHVFFVVSSAFIVITIALERHRRICSPFSHEMTTGKIKLMCLGASILGCLVAVPAILVYGEAEVETGVQNITGYECFIDPNYIDTSLPKLYFLTQLIICIVCMIVLGIFYFRIGRKIYQHHQFIRENTYTPTSPTGAGKNFSFCHKNSLCSESNDSKASGKDNATDSTKKTTDGSRESSPAKQQFDDVKPKGDPYRDLMKKVVKIKDRSRSSSPAPQQNGKSEEGQRTRLESSRSDKTFKTGPSLRTKQVTVMLFIITVVFILSFIPHLVLMVMNSMKPEILDDLSPFGVAIYNLFLRFFVINSMANPIIYGFCDRKFRSECTDLFMTVITCGRY